MVNIYLFMVLGTLMLDATFADIIVESTELGSEIENSESMNKETEERKAESDEVIVLVDVTKDTGENHTHLKTSQIEQNDRDDIEDKTDTNNRSESSPNLRTPLQDEDNLEIELTLNKNKSAKSNNGKNKEFIKESKSSEQVHSREHVNHDTIKIKSHKSNRRQYDTSQDRSDGSESIESISIEDQDSYSPSAYSSSEESSQPTNKYNPFNANFLLNARRMLAAPRLLQNSFDVTPKVEEIARPPMSPFNNLPTKFGIQRSPYDMSSLSPSLHNLYNQQFYNPLKAFQANSGMYYRPSTDPFTSVRYPRSSEIQSTDHAPNQNAYPYTSKDTETDADNLYKNQNKQVQKYYPDKNIGQVNPLYSERQNMNVAPVRNPIFRY